LFTQRRIDITKKLKIKIEREKYMNNIWKVILKSVICFFILLLSLIIVNLIPREYIEENVKESVQIFIDEGNYPKIKFARKYLLDNYTDALMLNTAYSIDSNSPIESTILMRRNYRPNEGLKLEKIGNQDNPIKYLIENLNKTNSTYFEYSIYWHGYMIYLRPLLVLFNYFQIRVIFTTMIIFLSILLIYLAYKKINKYIAIATTIMLFASNFWTIGLSLQYSAVFIISLLASIYIILNGKKKNIVCTFFIIGMLTSFFDLLTTPILTLGIPILFYISLHQSSFKDFFKIILYWGIGYGIMWFSKWIIADIMYNTGTIKWAFEKIMSYTTGTKEVTTNIIEVISKNIYYLSEILIFSMVLLATSYIFGSKNLNLTKEKSIYQYLIIAVLPFIWFAVIKNHSYIHARFTFRNLLITIFSVLLVTMNILKSIVENYEINKNKSK